MEWEYLVSNIGREQFKARKNFEEKLEKEKLKKRESSNNVNLESFDKNIDEYKDSFVRRLGYQ